MQLLSVIVPVYNEEKTVANVLARLLQVALPIPREIVVVNDGSTDGTRAALDGLASLPDVRVIHAEVNGGKGRAIRIGIGAVKGDILAIQDADLELDPAQLAELVEPILAGKSAVVYGSRFLAGRPPAPRSTVLANRALTMLTNLLYGSRLTDMETCYKVMRTDVARSLHLTADRFDIEPEITAKLLRSGYSIIELPVRFEPRTRAAGKKLRWRDGVHAVTMLIRHRLGR